MNEKQLILDFLEWHERIRYPDNCDVTRKIDEYLKEKHPDTKEFVDYNFWEQNHTFEA